MLELINEAIETIETNKTKAIKENNIDNQNTSATNTPKAKAKPKPKPRLEMKLKANKKCNITDSQFQTKTWRQKCDWYKNGKQNECEIYQKGLIKELISYEPDKTFNRFYGETVEIKSKHNPFKELDAFEYTENFDGKAIKGNNTIYFNLKFCCGAGGALNRTLREVYHFIKLQVEFIKKRNPELVDSIYFINILDGDTSYKNINKFKYLLQKENLDKKEIKILNKFIFIGSMYDFNKNQDLIKICKNE